MMGLFATFLPALRRRLTWLALVALGWALSLLLHLGGPFSAASDGVSSLPIASSAAAGETPLPRTHRAIVLFRDSVNPETILRLSKRGITHLALFDSIDAATVVGPRRSVDALASWRKVARLSPDDPILFHTYSARSDTRVNRVRSNSNMGFTGEGVSAAVIDSGIDETHPDLLGRVAVHVNLDPAHILDDITDGEYSSRYAEMPAVTDELGHGTAVAGILGGSGEAAAGSDMSGVAPDVTLVDLKIGTTTQGSFVSSALAAYQWILDHQNDPRFPGGIRITSNSWGASGGGSEQALRRMIKRAHKAGINMIFSAGNDGPDADSVVPIPNSFDEVITVGAVCKHDGTGSSECERGEVASFSGRGAALDVVAPGVEIWSPRSNHGALTVLRAGKGESPPGNTGFEQSLNRGLYMSGSGTSAAAPHVAGVVALILEAAPDLRPPALRRILISTARDRGRTGFDHDYGSGLVDAFAAVQRALSRLPLAP